MTLHVGRSFGTDHHLEDTCPCPQEPCGLVSTDRIRPDCPQHAPQFGKSLRQGHDAADCPGHGEHDQPAPPRHATRVPYLSQVIRGGVLGYGADPTPNPFRERAYTLRLDRAPHGVPPLSMPVWLAIELTDDERRQWVDVLADGLP